MAEEPFDETPHGRQTVSVIEASDGTKLVGFLKYAKLDDSSGSTRLVRRKGKYFFIPFNKLSKLISVLRGIARKFGWKLEETDLEKRLEELNNKIGEMDVAISDYKSEIDVSQQKRTEYEEQIKRLTGLLVKSRIPAFKQDLKDFASLLEAAFNGKVREEDVQKFLMRHPWMFGVEFIKAEPKKPAGSKSKFDFYLLDYKRHGVVIELKKPNETIFASEYVLSQRVTQGLGQLIRYLETTAAISHSSDLSQTESLEEKKPQGYLIIGRTRTEREADQLHRVNSYLHRISVETYDDIVAKADLAVATFAGEPAIPYEIGSDEGTQPA